MSTTISKQDVFQTLMLGSAIGHAQGSPQEVRKPGLTHLARALEGKEENPTVTLPTGKAEGAFISDVLRALGRMFDRKSNGHPAFRGSMILVNSEEEGRRLSNRLTRDHALDSGAVAVYSQEEQALFNAKRKQRFTDHLRVDEVPHAQTETLAPKFYKRHLIITKDDFVRLSRNGLILPEQRPVVVVQGSQTPMSKRAEDVLQEFAQEGAQILRVGSEEVSQRRAPSKPTDLKARFKSALRELMKKNLYDHDDVAMYLNDRLKGTRVEIKRVEQWCKGNFQTLTNQHVELMAMMFKLTGDDCAEFVALGLQLATKTKSVPEEKKPSENEAAGYVMEGRFAPRRERDMRVSGDATAAFGGIIHMNVDHVGFPKFASQEELQRRFKTQLRQLILDSKKSNESIAMGTNDLADNRRIQQDWVKDWRKKEGHMNKLTHRDIVRALARTLSMREPALSDFVSLWEQATGRAPILLREEKPVRVRKPRGPRGQKTDTVPEEGVTEEIMSPSEGQSAPEENAEPESTAIFRRKLAEILNTHMLFGDVDNAEVAAYFNGELGQDLVSEEQIAQWRDGKGPLPEEAVIHELVTGCELDDGDRFLACYEAAVKQELASPLPDISDDRGEQAAPPQEPAPVPPADEPPMNGHSVPGTVIDATSSIMHANDVAARKGDFPGMVEFCDRSWVFFDNDDEQIAYRINKRLPPEDAVSPQTVANWRAGEEIPGIPVARALVTALNIPKARGDAFIRNLRDWHDAADARQSVGESQAHHADAVRERRYQGHAAQR